jgi:hypothetical protein
MNTTSCDLLATVEVHEPCTEQLCPFWENQCLLIGLRSEMSRNPPLVRFLLGLREDLEDGSRTFLGYAPGFN